MVQPIQYQTQFPQGLPDPTRELANIINIAGGIQQLRGRREERERLEQQALLAAQRRQQYEDDVAALGDRPSAQGIAGMILKYPDLQEQLQTSHQILSADEQKTQLDQASQVYSAMLANKPEIARGLLAAQAETYRNEGNEEEAQEREQLSLLIESDPGEAMQATGVYVAAQLGPEDFVERFAKLEKARLPKEQRTTLMKNLQAAGLKPGTKEYKDAVLAGTQTGTTVQIGPQTESQRRDDFLAGVVDDSLDEMQDAMAGFDPTSPKAAVIQMLPQQIQNWVKTEDYQRFTGAARPVIEAYLVKITGAAYSEVQQSGAVETYMPQPGDKPGTVAKKIERIRDFGQALKKSAGYDIEEKVPEGKKDPAKLTPEEQAQVPTQALETRTVIETRTLPDGRTIVRYSDDSFGFQ